jgi:nitric oxide reductase subunit C
VKIQLLVTLIVCFAGYSGWVYTGATGHSDRNPVLSDAAVRGKLVFQSKNCASCHQLYGLGGYLGPDLTTSISRKSPDYCRAIIMAGTLRMPNLKLTREETEALIEYLTYVDRSAYHYRRAADPAR